MIRNNPFETPDEHHDWAREMLKEHGWFMHFVSGVETGFYNAHTHGLTETTNHLDLQIYLPIEIHVEAETTLGVFHSAIDLIKKGIALEPGKRYEQIIHLFPVECQLAEETNRQVLRLILPDHNGFFPSDEKCHPIYRKQYEGIISLHYRRRKGN